MKRLFAVICLFIWMPIPAMGGWFGPSNYEECILENMKGVASDAAVRAIARVCRKKFPPVESKLRSSSLPKMNEQIKQYLINQEKAVVQERLAEQLYEECILENMNGVASDKAAMAIMRACRKKFPPVESKLRSSSLPKMDEQTKQYLINKGKAVVKERVAGYLYPDILTRGMTDEDYIRIGLEGYSNP